MVGSIASVYEALVGVQDPCGLMRLEGVRR